MTIPLSSPNAFPSAMGLSMSLRDYFAACALPETMRMAREYAAITPGDVDPADVAARAAYDLADAMLRRREVSP